MQCNAMRVTGGTYERRPRSTATSPGETYGYPQRGRRRDAVRSTCQRMLYCLSRGKEPDTIGQPDLRSIASGTRTSLPGLAGDLAPRLQ